MKIIYINCNNGISGDMLLSAIINSGIITPAQFEKKIKQAVPSIARYWKFKVTETERNRLPCTLTEVIGDKTFHSANEIHKLIKSSKLPDNLKAKALKILNSLILSESKVHKLPYNKVHFHEMSHIDTLVDITGTVIGISLFNANKIISSPINIGTGVAPASANILSVNKAPVYIKSKPDTECTTPTGAAIISNITDEFKDTIAPMIILRTGYGAGMRDDGSPNILRLIYGNTEEKSSKYDTDTVIMLETNIDDMDPRIYPYLTDKLLSAGCLDVWLSQVMMKKGRPGIVLNVIANSGNEHTAVEMIFRETTTIGIRRSEVSRYKLPRHISGKYKLSKLPDGAIKKSVEYETAVREIKSNPSPLKDKL